MEKEEFRQSLKRKRKIENQSELTRIIVYEALQKEFWKIKDEEVMIFTTFENFLERLEESYDFSDLPENEIEKAEKIAFERLVKNYNVLAGPGTLGDDETIYYAVNAKKIKNIKNPAETLFFCDRDEF